MKLLNENCPMQCVRIKSRINKPWFTNGLKNACRKKNNLYKSWLANKTECAQQKYKKYRNKLSLILRKAEKAYYKNKLNESKNDVKRTWSVINEVIKKGRQCKKYSDFMYRENTKVHNKHDIANMFNDFYINVGPKLASEIDTNNVGIQYDTYIKDLEVENSMFITPCNEKEVDNIISGFKNKSSQDTCGISMSLIKQIKGFIVKPLNVICNLSFSTGIFPEKNERSKSVAFI